MTPLSHPPTQAAQERSADLGEGIIPLAAPPPSEISAGPRRSNGRSYILTILVLALAFLAASFPARNSDLWFHLATGRLLAQGRFPFGADPFAYTTQQVYWACHSWLFDWALYGLRGLIGDAGLIVLKALLVTALAALLLHFRRAASARWMPAFCTTLALLALGPRLLLQPTCVSYFLLGLSMWLLWQQQRAGSLSDGRSLAYTSASLLLVFLLWVNVDEWFLLGPLLAALFWLGEKLQPARSASDGSRRTPGWIVPSGLAVCLLNPYTYHAFTLPAELSPVTWTSGLRQDERFWALFASPWDAQHLHAALRLDASVLSYYVLSVLGLASFVLYPSALREWRLLVWLPFAVLAAWQARLIPFFAVVAAPITALNWQDIAAVRPTAQNEKGRFLPGSAYISLLLSLLSLIVLAWMGWLAGYDREERHVAWRIQADPSLRQAAQTLNEWRRRGLLPDGQRTLALAPEAAGYSAWFCPGARHFFDYRYPLFPHAARDYETVCRELLSYPSGAEEQRTADWQRLLREHHVGVVVFYDREPKRLFAALHRLADDAENWKLLSVAGQALIAGWIKARPPGGFDSLAFDADRLAYAPPDGRTEREAPPAPERGPEQLPPRRGLRARLTHPPAPPSWESAAAAAYLDYFHASEAAQRQQKWLFLLPAYAASLAGLPAQPAALPQAAFQLLSSRELLLPGEAAQFLVREQLGPFFASMVERPPALPLLAIRAARRAVADNPEDANAWFRLGQAYLLLRDFTFEHCNEGMLPPLSQLRHMQIVTVFEQALRLDPNLEAAHHDLAYLYGLNNSLDQAADHRHEELRLSRQAGPRPGESAEEFAYRMELFDKDTAKLVELVEYRRKKYATGSNSFPGDRLAQARLALKLGLARMAVDEILLPCPADLLGADGIRMELELLLSMGRVQEVRGILNDKGLRGKEQGLGYSTIPPPPDREKLPLYSRPYRWPAYQWLRVLEGAAIGDYAVCREDLRVIRAFIHAQHDRLRQQAGSFERRIPGLAPHLLSGQLPFLPAFIAVALGRASEERRMLEAELRTLLAQQADLCVLEALLALEQGDADAARSAFAAAQDLVGEAPFAGRPIVAGYLGKLRAYQHANGRN